jgi:putative thioredoxin
LIAAQFQIRSIPTVYGDVSGPAGGRPDQYRTEAATHRVLDQALKQLPVQGEAQAQAAELEPLIAMGKRRSIAEMPRGRRAFLARSWRWRPEHPQVLAGLIRAMAAQGRIEEAEALAASLDPEQVKEPNMARALAALTLAKEAKPVDDLAGLKAQVEADPDNHALRFELAGGQMAAGDRDGAAENLLAIIKADRDWNEGAARTQLLKLFEVIGLEDPWVAATRRKLSAILFG